MTPEANVSKCGKFLYAIAALDEDRSYDVTGIDGSATTGSHLSHTAKT